MRGFEFRTQSRLVVAAIFATFGLVGGTVSAAQQCYDFQAAAAGTTFVVGDTQALANADVEWEAFENAAGTLLFGGSAEVVVSNEAGGTATQELDARNINTLFTFDPDVDRARFVYADLSVDSGGANVNFAVNGDFRNVPSLAALNGQVVGGANVVVNFVNGIGFQVGIVEITAPTSLEIDDVLVGGQEFFLDDMCFHW